MNLLSELLYDLNTISDIKKYSRINTSRGRLVIEPESALQCVWRWRSGESRDKTVFAISNIIRTVIAMSEMMFGGDHHATQVQIYDALYKAGPGLHHLVATYDDDADIKFRINQIITMIDEHNNKLKSIIFVYNNV